MHHPRIVAYSLMTTVLVHTMACQNGATPEVSSAHAAVQAAAPFANAAPSLDALVDQFLAALATKDRSALEHLRVSETEYREIILPGSAPQGQSPRIYPEQPSKYFWNLMNSKSVYSLNHLIGEFGGHAFTRKQTRYAKGEQDYAWYRAHKNLQLTLEDEHGQEVELRTGSIAEINGQYKFISFVMK